MSFYRTMYRIFAPAVRFVYRLRAVGVENIPQSGCILASNHTAFSDVLIISAAAKRQVRYMAKKELFRIPLLAQLITGLGAYPVNRGGADVGSIKRTIHMLEEGELIGIFPQGHRHGGVDPRTTEVKGGIGMIAYHTKANVIPAFVDSKRGKTGMFRRNTVIFGEPIPYDTLGFVNGGVREYQDAAEYIFRKVCALKYGEEAADRPAGSVSDIPESTSSHTPEETAE
ncbi:MAG: 1-acyl-sn-glycerol-3-phosphate acyltransferase [Clostridia bacterium]|nr:1-acyl-sn-glycerol-3-phosphate acyltransferase [Clostridia bacterium]